MTKVEIDGKTYCVETLIYTVERLTKDVKASAEYHRLVLEQIRAEIDSHCSENRDRNDGLYIAMKIIDKHTKGDSK